MAAMEAEAPGQFWGQAAAAAVAAPLAVPEWVVRPDGHEREALEGPGDLLGRPFGRTFALLCLCRCGISPLGFGGTPAASLPGFIDAPALFLPVLGAGEKLDRTVAPAVVVAFDRTAARKADADKRLGVAATQGHTVALPPVSGDIAKMLVAHFSSLSAAGFAQSWMKRHSPVRALIQAPSRGCPIPITWQI